VPGRTRHLPGGFIDEEIVTGESTVDGGAQRDRFDDRRMPGIGQSEAGSSNFLALAGRFI
jgi:hypothetical protein